MGDRRVGAEGGPAAGAAEVLGLDSEYVYPMAGYLPPDCSSPATDLVHAVYAAEFSDDQLLLLLDRVWQE
ncbi:MAG: hypothetical protein M3P95_02465 [Actinomycetota bacterium]|nr:hypothetical protein [Actinomycetota bacterium]